MTVVSNKVYKAALALVAEFESAKKAKQGTAKVSTTKARRKTTNRKAVVGGAVEGHRCLTRKNREMFVVDHDWAGAHDSVSDLVGEVVLGKAPLVGTWAIGTGHVAKALKVDESTVSPVTRESQGGKVKKARAKKTKAAKVVEVAEVVDAGPEWGSPAWIAATHPREKDTPRNAKGQSTPRKEWPIRIELERSGKNDRNEVDAKVKAAYDAGLIEA